MPQIRVVLTGLAVGLTTLAISGCKRENTAPDLQTTTGLQGRAEPMSVAGCLRKGVADNTYILVASQATGATETATYQLTRPDMAEFQQYVGQTVEVSGTLRAEQEIATSGGTVAEKPAKGASGTPTVETKTDLAVKILNVGAVRPLGSPCAQ
jgi:hypothetical protein